MQDEHHGSKVISCILVNFSQEEKVNLQRKLLQELYYEPNVLDEPLKELKFVTKHCKVLVSMVQALNKAKEYILYHFYLIV